MERHGSTATNPCENALLANTGARRVSVAMAYSKHVERGTVYPRVALRGCIHGTDQGIGGILAHALGICNCTSQPPLNAPMPIVSSHVLYKPDRRAYTAFCVCHDSFGGRYLYCRSSLVLAPFFFQWFFLPFFFSSFLPSLLPPPGHQFEKLFRIRTTSEPTFFDANFRINCG